jgi:HEAT repeat protein
MEGIGTVADPGTADDARAGLDDADGQVRSLAAVALARMNDPAALDALADTLDDWPDLLHSEMSRSAYELPGLGLRALSVAIPLLSSADWADRAKGDWVIRAVLRRTGDDHDTNDLSQIMQDFTPDADADQRKAAAARAADWLRSSGLPDR